MRDRKKIPLIYLIGMPVIFIVANLIGSAHLNIFSAQLYISVLLYPLTYLISGIIVKKSDYKTALIMMVVSLISATLVNVMEWAFIDSIDSLVAIYSFLSFLICQLIFIYTYDFLIKMKKDSYGFVFLLMLVVSLIDNAFYGIIIENHYVSISILIRVLYMAIIPAVLANKDKKSIKNK